MYKLNIFTTHEAYFLMVFLTTVLLPFNVQSDAIDQVHIFRMVETGKRDEVKSYLEKGGPANLVQNGDTLLTMAVRQGDIEIIDRLLEAGANPNGHAPRCHFAIPLHISIQENNLDIVKRLIKAGARTSNTYAPLLAAYTENIEMISFLIDQGLDPADCAIGRLWLEGAVSADSVSVIDYLVSRGADPCCPNTGLLHQAAGLGSKRALLRLIALGMDPNEVNSVGNKPIDLATDEGIIEILQSEPLSNPTTT